MNNPNLTIKIKILFNVTKYYFIFKISLYLKQLLALFLYMIIVINNLPFRRDKYRRKE